MKKYIDANIKASEPPKEQEQKTWPNCNKNLLEVGINENVAISGDGFLYHRVYNGSLENDGVEDADYDIYDTIRYRCGDCNYELEYDEISNLLP